ncbi:MAG: universal stress protein, partial [Nitrospirota bacterium]|nr:universal stress protein [Nitrospirota bacterium]
FVPYGGYLKGEEERLREEARIRFEDWQKSLSEHGVNSRIIIEVGDPVPGILSIAELEAVDLIVVNRKKRAAFDMSLLGSQTLKIITRSKIPVLVNKYIVEFEREGRIVTRINGDIFKKPLFASDCSGFSGKALDLLLLLDGLIEKAYVSNVIDSKLSKSYDRYALDTIENDRKQKLAEYCDRLKSAGIDAEQHLGAGEIAAEIIRLSRQVGASIIVMRTTGKNRLAELFEGSHSHKVAEKSELPIILVP